MILSLLTLALVGDTAALAQTHGACLPANGVATESSTPADPAGSAAATLTTVSICAPRRSDDEIRSARALSHLNAVREAAGSGPLARSPVLDESASRHAAYLSRNGFHSAPSPHAETAGLTAFSGADPFSRMRAAGYRSSYATEVIGDIGAVTPDTDCLDHLMNTIYHAALLLSRVTEAGVAYGAGHAAGMCTIDLAAPRDARDTQAPGSGEIVRYPASGMTLPTGTFRVGSESPRPPPSVLPNASAGIPVLVGLRNADFLAAPTGASAIEIQRFELADRHGQLVPSVVLADALVSGPGFIADASLHGAFVALVPRVPLAPGRYRVTLHATIGGTHVVAPEPWWFTILAPAGDESFIQVTK